MLLKTSTLPTLLPSPRTLSFPSSGSKKMPPPRNLTTTTTTLLRSLENFAPRFMYKAMIATIDASLRGERTQPIYALSCVEDVMISGNDEDIITFGSSWNSQISQPSVLVLCGRSVMYLPHFFPWSSCADLNTKGAFKKSNVAYYGKAAMNGVSVGFNFYQTLWSLPDPLEVKAFEQVWSKEESICVAFIKTPFEKKPGQPGARTQYATSFRKPGLRLGSKELRQVWKLAEQIPNVLTRPDCVHMLSIMEYWKPLAEDAKKGYPKVYTSVSTGHSTTAGCFITADNGTAANNGSSISVTSRAANTLGSGDDDPDEEGRKCLQGSDSRPLVQRVEIGRREQLDNLNPVDVILLLDSSSPVEERSQILRAGQARNFQFVQNKSYYEAIYQCILSNSEVHDQELPAIEPLDDHSQPLENEQNVEAENQETGPFVQELAQQLPIAEVDLADLLPEGGMESADDDGEQDGDYSPSNSAGAEEDDDAWLQFPCFFEENIVENLDLLAIDIEEEQNVPEDTFEEEEEEGMEDYDADYSLPNSTAEEDSDTWLQFPYFFEENIVENLDLLVIDLEEEQEVLEVTSDEEEEETFNSDPDYAPIEEDDPNADEAEW